MTKVVDPVYEVGEEVAEAVVPVAGPIPHGEDPDGHVGRQGITGVHNDEMRVHMESVELLLEQLLDELKIMNIHLSLITDDNVQKGDIE